ncbi:MAG: D-aminoacyl-tRNA deacylase [Acidiferrobacterales bacterium]|nr:D-aminoacyl-tRNA deacylase [Acidiferrobacterales bacterium]
MIGLLQRVQAARVTVEDRILAEIDRGLLVLVGVERGDDERKTKRLLDRILGYRVFPDSEGRMNLSLRDVDGALLLVPNFTLAADTGKGMRASFTSVASPAEGELLFAYLVDYARHHHQTVRSGIFGAQMQVSLTNDGPVTFWLKVS